MKECCKCGELKQASEFNKDSSRKDGLYPQCRSCRNSALVANYSLNKEEITRKQREAYKNSNGARSQYLRKWYSENRERACFLRREREKSVKDEVFTHYGKVCQCCGEDQIEFLAIDHINGGGGKHRKEIGAGGIHFYRWLKRNNFPNGYQVLCHNCNMAKGFFGKCPHKKTIDTLVQNLFSLAKFEAKDMK